MQTHFGATPHDLHRARRMPLNRYFSKASVTKLEPRIRSYASKLCVNLKTHAGSGKPVDLPAAISCYTTDVVTEYSFARSFGCLEDPSFTYSFHRAICEMGKSVNWIKHFPVLLKVLLSLPEYALLIQNSILCSKNLELTLLQLGSRYLKSRSWHLLQVS